MFTRITERVDELMKQDGTHPKDIERKTLFFIISGNEELWKLRESIYDFKERSIESDILESDICTSSKTLIKIAFNLFNSSPTDSLIDCFSRLDENNFELAMQAIRLRFNKNLKEGDIK